MGYSALLMGFEWPFEIHVEKTNAWYYESEKYKYAIWS